MALSERRGGIWSGRAGLMFFLAGMLVSNIGRSAYFVSIIWFVLMWTNSVRSVTALLLVSTLAQFLSSGISGFLADVTDRRHLSIGLDITRAFTVAMTGFSMMAGMGISAIYVLVAIFSISDRGYLSAMQALIPVLTCKDSAVGANSASYLMMQSGTFLGAVLSGFLLSFLPYGLAVSTLGIIFCSSAAIVLAMPIPSNVRGVNRKPNFQWKQFISIGGLRESKLIVATFYYTLVFGVGILINTLLAAYVVTEIKGDAVLFAQMESAWALGAVFVCLFLSIGVGAASKALDLTCCILMLGSGLILLWMFPAPLFVVITLVALGGIYNLGRISLDVQVQQTVNASLIGRTKGTINTVATGGGLVIFTLLGLVSDRLTSSSLFAYYGLFVVVVTVLLIVASSIRFRYHGSDESGEC